MSKKALLNKKKEASSVSSPSSASSDLAMVRDNPFIAPETKGAAKNPFIAPKVEEVSEEPEAGSDFAPSAPEQESFTPQITAPSIVSKPKAIEESTKMITSASSMVAPSASEKKKKR